MAEEQTDEESAADDRNRWLRGLGRLASTALVALAGLLLALGDPGPVAVTVLVVGVWLWLAIAVITGIARIATAVNTAAASGTSENFNPLRFLFRIPRVCMWAGVLLVAVAVAALFAAGQGALATTMEVFLLWRLAVAMADDRPCRPACERDAGAADYTPLTGAPGILNIVAAAGAAWLVLGAPPFWAESLILTWIWMITIMLIAINCVLAFGVVSKPWMENARTEHERRSGVRTDVPPPPPGPPVTPEPPRSWTQQLTMWLWRASWIVVAWALWTAGQPLLAGLYMVGHTLKLAVRVRLRRQRHGDTARIDFLARAVHVLVWWPLVISGTVIGVAGAAAVLVPLGILGAIWERIAGTPRPSRPDPQTSWEREQRLTRARVRRAAASYRLREAFGKPEGFVYFLYSEPHQREHFLGPGGLLAGMGDRVVARDWRGDVTPARKAAGWTRFEQTPEGALLHVNGVGSMQKDLPLIAVAPARGTVQVFRLSEAYRARSRDKGAALEKTEMDVRAAIAVVLGPGAE